MKRRFTILTAAIALLTILAFPMGMWGQTTVSYGWETTDDAANWTITGDIVATSGQGNTGDYAGKISTNNTYVQFKEKVYVNSFSFAFKRTSNNNNYNVYIETSTDGNTWTAVETYAMSSFSNGSYTTKTHTFDGSTQYYVRFHCYNTTAVRYVDDVTITYSDSGTNLEENDLSLSPTELNFDLYNDYEAKTITITTSCEGDISVSANDYVTTEINDNIITVTPGESVTQETQTIIVTQASDGTYTSGTATFTVNITDSTPFTGGDVTFDATKDKGTSPLVKNGVSFECTNGVLNNGSEYRLYKNSVTTFSVSQGTITQIAFTCTSDNPASGFASQSGWTTNYNNGTWNGNSNEVSFTASEAQVRATLIVVTVDLGSIPDPSITAENISIEYNVTSGVIEYTINNAVDGGTLTANTESDWLTLGLVGETVPFTCTVNEAGTQRTATVTLTYTYNGETLTKEVTVTQGAAPVSYTTIPDLFAAATTTESPVYVTFNNWVVSGVSTNGKNVFVTDNNGNGFVIYYSSDMSETYTEGNILSGTAISCTLKLYNGFAELLNVDASNLTITAGGTVTTANVAMADLTGVNTGALLHYNNLTCSVNNNKYYLTDGTTTLQVYNALYAFDALEDGKTYNITGVYQQYNSTKEIMPRSAADIEEVVITTPSITVDPATVSIPVEGAEGTLTVTYENITEIIAEVYFCDAEGAEATYDWITAEINDDNNIEYLVEENDGEARTAYLKVYALDDNTEDVYSNLVTFNQAAYVAPATGDEYALYSGELVEGDYLIVYDGGAMNTTVESDRLQYEAVTATNNVIVTDNAEIVWHIAQSGQYWTIYNADAEAYAASTGAKNKAQMLTDGTDDKALWTVSGTETYEFVNKQNAANNVNANLRKNGTYGFACYATSTGGALLLYKKVVEPETHTLYIPGYSNATNPEGGYYLIASPVTVNPEDVEGDPQGMIDGNFDLYYFDQAEENEWRNYEAQSFNLVPGKGYLYAHDTDVELTLTGTPYSGNGVFPLSYTEDAVFAGWNLIGNPYNYDVTVDKDFYIMNEDGDEIIPAEEQVVARMQGIFVVATAAGQTVTFSKYVAPIVPLGKLVLNLNHNRGTVIDRAIVRFGEGEQLPKFQLFENSTKLYIPQGNSDYAIVRSAAEGEMPVNFKAKENGTYTISVNTENIEMDYLHLIDNMTGTDVDLLQTPSYTFEASTRDYASRFRLVFSAEENGASAGSATFAYFNGNEWVVSNEGDAQLHVIDMTGRIVSTETINGNATVKVNAAPGVYMLRLVNGNDIKTQKVIIK